MSVDVQQQIRPQKCFVLQEVLQELLQHRKTREFPSCPGLSAFVPSAFVPYQNSLLLVALLLVEDLKVATVMLSRRRWKWFALLFIVLIRAMLPFIWIYL